jgi:hypothetical protein
MQHVTVQIIGTDDDKMPPGFPCALDLSFQVLRSEKGRLLSWEKQKGAAWRDMCTFKHVMIIIIIALYSKARGLTFCEFVA